MGDAEVNEFLKHLRTKGLRKSSQRQALSGLRFLYQEVLHTRLGDIEEIACAERIRKEPPILSLSEFQRIVAHAEGMEKLVFQLLFGTGLRLAEALRLRIRDIDREGERIHVRNEDAKTTRYTVLPVALEAGLLQHLRHVQTLHRQDVREGYGEAAHKCHLRPLSARASTHKGPSPTRERVPKWSIEWDLGPLPYRLRIDYGSTKSPSSLSSPPVMGQSETVDEGSS